VHISQLLNVAHALKVLNVLGNDIGDDGMAVILEALQHNKSLTKLVVARCGLLVKGIVVRKICDIANYINYHIRTNIGGYNIWQFV